MNRHPNRVNLVSIVIPTYNGERYLSATIESVLSQTVTDWELIIVDDGSGDGTYALASAYARRDPRICLIRQPNGGLADARNRGLHESDRTSPYVAFLDHDDLWETEALQVLLDALGAHPEAVAAHGLSRIIDTYGHPREPGELECWGRRRVGVTGYQVSGWPFEAPTTLAVLSYRNVIYTPGQVLARRSVLDRVGSFDATVAPCEDWDMWLRLSQRGAIHFVDRVLLNYRKHMDSMSQKSDWLAQGQYLVRRKLLASPDLSAEQRRTVVVANWWWGRQIRSSQMSWARDRLRRGALVSATRQFSQAARNYLDCVRGLPARMPLFEASHG